MEAWEACFFVLFLDLAFGRDIPINVTYVVKQIDSCPDVGYFFRREPSPNIIDSGPCYLCFCQKNGTAICWERERKRCDVEKFHHHRVGRSHLDYYKHARSRRSSNTFADIFFRGASRNFFENNLPKKCKPSESFSDGCPPVDWCVGCTICDCDANNHWDCHVLSFCEDDKKKVPRRGTPREKTISLNNVKLAKTTTKKPMRRVYNNTVKNKRGTKNFGKPMDNKLLDKNVSGKVRRKPFEKTSLPKKPQVKKSQPKKPQQKTPQPKHEHQKRPHEKKLQPKRPQPKKSQPKKPQPMRLLSKTSQQNRQNSSMSKVMKKYAQPVSLKRGTKNKVLNINPKRNNTVRVGQKIVKRAVQNKFVKDTKPDNGAIKAKLKNGDKRTHNSKSNAAARNINKNKRQATIKGNSTYSRPKREILNESQTNVDDLSVITFKPDDNAVIPLKLDSPKSSAPNISSDNVTIPTTMSIPTTQHNDYFKYSVNSFDNKTRIVEHAKSITKYNERNIDAITTKPKNNISMNGINKTGAANNLDINKVKFTKWFVIKVQKENRNNTTAKEYISNKLKKKHVNTENYITKKYKTMNKLATRNQNGSVNFMTTPNYDKMSEDTSLDKILQTLLRIINNNDETRQQTTPKVSIMKYVRKFFHKIFSTKKTLSHKGYEFGEKENHTLQVLCDNFGPCKINKRNKFVLYNNLKRLNKETEAILSSIKTIKRLLHLLELPNCRQSPNHGYQSFYQNEMQKLVIVLRDNFNIEHMNTSLTDTQAIKKKYIKKNTHTFIQSVKRFAVILNETLAIIRPTPATDYSEQTQKHQHNSVPYHKIKRILYKYNIIQNNFMRKMYDLMNEMEKTPTTTERIRGKMVDLKVHTTNHVIEKYSINIIENLRRLRNLAEVLNSKRKKRNITAGNGAVDYLLTLMEYLIKQNQAMDSAPANDGIDLLIDAIRSAPDIKPIEKKNRKLSPTRNDELVSDTELSGQLLENSDTDSKRLSAEENKIEHEEKNTSDSIKHLGQNNILKDDDNREVEQTTEYFNDMTQKVYYKAYNDITETNYENMTETTQKYSNITKKRSNENKEETGFDEFESEVANTMNNLKKFDFYVDREDAAFEEVNDNVLVVANNSADDRYIAEEQITFTTHSPKTNSKTAENVSSESKSSETRDVPSLVTKLDWLEETFDREIKEFSDLNASYPSTPIVAHDTMPRTTQTIPVRYKNTDNVSGISVEEPQLKSKVKNESQSLNVEDVMRKKEMDLWNSLDYGTERTDFDESGIGNSKDDTKLDDAYFV